MTAIVAALVLAAVATAWLCQEDECRRYASPDGRYVVIATSPRYESLMPALPGQSGDRSGFLTIEDTAGTFYGKIPVPMVWMAGDVEWTEHGAELAVFGEWDFSTREYRYWNNAQTREIVRHAR